MKAVLVLDEIPKSCVDCQFFGDRKGYDGYDKCFANAETIIGQDNKRWNNCPLKELPQKNGNKWYRGNERDFRDGWNSCLEEILGEEKMVDKQFIETLRTIENYCNGLECKKCKFNLEGSKECLLIKLVYMILKGDKSI